jgi:hypothetical protein
MNGTGDVKCGVCGQVFGGAGREVCAGCPLHRKCRLLRCPNCGFEFPPEPAWARRLHALIERKTHGHETERQR